MDFSLYLDESGGFQGPGPLGLRLVAGVLMRGRPEAHREPLDALLAERLGWWPGARHASDLRAHKIALLLGTIDASKVPFHLAKARRELRALGSHGRKVETLRAQNRELFSEVCGESERLMCAGSAAVGEACRLFEGGLVLAVEQDLGPDQSRYPPMLEAAIEAAIIELILRGAQGSCLHVLAEERSDASGPDVAGIEAAAQEIWRRLEREGAPPQIAPGPYFHAKDAHPGLVLADFASYRLGPRRFATVELSEAERRRWVLARLSQKVRSRFGASCLAATDALAARSLLREALAGAGRGELERSRKNPPEGAVRAPYESALATLDAARGSRS